MKTRPQAQALSFLCVLFTARAPSIGYVCVHTGEWSQAPPQVRDRVLSALPALALDASGRLPPRPPAAALNTATGAKEQTQRQDEREEVEGEEAERCVDVFLWLKIMMKCFAEEQVNRAAAVGVMFATVHRGNASKEALARLASARRAGLDLPPTNDAPAEVSRSYS